MSGSVHQMYYRTEIIEQHIYKTTEYLHSAEDDILIMKSLIICRIPSNLNFKKSPSTILMML